MKIREPILSLDDERKRRAWAAVGGSATHYNAALPEGEHARVRWSPLCQRTRATTFRLAPPPFTIDMWSTCGHVLHMSSTVMIQVRNVPSGIHRKLKARAAQLGVTLSELVLSELKRSLERPTEQEFWERLATRTRVKLDDDVETPAEVIRAARDAR